ncbi:hypothetical protein DTO96_101743 [Ephemeroptericola cinctiostellae]|uniref:MoaF-like domain-containing protein n=1 Tax=Ephemeroptericola cinctiostellae TaxID=2268024 RepID=A0A345DCB5_9BURK|nr:MoaF C-terminal domain-containing protein [Ephemeroptericola cinctiostellae]AXF86003.1 hypothetical protein DTO96_101743 [Ephemeroptericola cinctiostellae]
MLSSKTFRFDYPNSLSYRLHIQNGTQLNWECLAGDDKGRTGTETYQMSQVGEQQYFLSWLEQDDIAVAELLDLNACKVYAQILIPTSLMGAEHAEQLHFVGDVTVL